MRKNLFDLFVLAFSLALTATAAAAPITFIYTGSGDYSAQLDGVPFSDADFTITATGDTDDRQSFANGFFIEHLTSSISIAGVGTFDFITATRTFVNNTGGGGGFSRSSGPDLYTGQDPVFFAWDMLSSIGPVGGASWGFLQWALSPVITTGGELVFSDGLIDNATFQAIVGTQVPEPASIALVALALLVLVAVRTRGA
jgi:hypothetical protein